MSQIEAEARAMREKTARLREPGWPRGEAIMPPPARPLPSGTSRPKKGPASQPRRRDLCRSGWTPRKKKAETIEECAGTAVHAAVLWTSFTSVNAMPGLCWPV